jgi:hypothetical protein
MLEEFFGDTADDVAGVAGSAFRWMSERDRARYEAQWRTAQAQQAGAVAAAYGASSAASVAITSAASQRTTTIIMIMAVVLILFRIRPTGNG